MSENVKDMMENETEEKVVYPYSVAVRFKNADRPYSFGTFSPNYHKGDWVVVETAKGLDMGEAETDATSIERYGLRMPEKGVIRIANERDKRDYASRSFHEKEAYDVCNEEIRDLELNMNLLSASYTLDRSKVLFIYVSESRVDFRELLKRLGSRLHCKIELRQIGERDKAQMVGGIGMCGMECCCKRYIKRFDPISIGMAKNQNLALNTEKLSGMCGKLMCCLKYEDDIYKELTKGLPKMNSQVEYEGNIYRLTNLNVMNEEAKLENHEAVLFITLAELREKAIPRKGVVMQRRHDGDEKKVVKKSVTRGNNPQDVTPHVSMELPSMAEKQEKKRRPDRKNNNNNNQQRDAKKNDRKQSQNNNRRNDRRRDNNAEKPKTETRNITVRTFGRKKKEESKEQ